MTLLVHLCSSASGFLEQKKQVAVADFKTPISRPSAPRSLPQLRRVQDEDFPEEMKGEYAARIR